MKCLIVGGDHDGDWIDVDTRQSEIRLPVKLSIQEATKFTIMGTAPYMMQSYKREEFRDADGTVYFAYFGGDNINSPMRRLIDGYRALARKSNKEG